MTIAELIEQLQQLEQDRVVVLSSDGEGNSYHELYSLGTCMYSGGYSGSIGLEELTEDLVEDGYGEEDVMEDGIKAVVLSP